MKRCLRLFIAPVVAVVCASQAFAQDAPPRQPGVFGGFRPQAAARSSLDLTASFIEGYDDDVPPALRGSLDPSSLYTGGMFSMLNVSAAYARRSARVQLGANATSILRYYNELGAMRNPSHSAGIGVTARLSQNTTLFANQSAAYAPTYFYGLFPPTTAIEPGNPGITAPDYSLNDIESYAYTTTATLSRRLSSRSSLSGTGEYRFTDRLQETARWRDVGSYTLRGDYTRSVSTRTAFNGGFRYRSGEFGYTERGTTTELAAEFGMNHIRPLSGTRQLLVKFNIGVSGADYPQPEFSPLFGFRRQLVGVGDVAVGLQVGRSWEVRGTFKKGLEYVVDLPQPVYAMGYSAGVVGLLTRRIDLSVYGGYSSGDSLLSRDSLLYDSYTGDVRLRFAVTRTMATFVEYLYYYYYFRGSAQLLAGIPPGLERNGVRAGLTLWMPALRR